MSNNRKRKTPLYTSHFTIDGENPIEPHPQILALKPDSTTHQGPGRHRSVDLKGIILELIEEIYPPLICPSCFHKSKGRAEADQHLKEKHHGQKLYNCASTSCEQAYSSKGGLRYHIEHNHKVTSSNTAAEISLSNEKRRSTTSRKEPAKKPELSDRLTIQLNTVYPLNTCPECNKVFKRKTHVVNHLVDDHRGKEPYKCIVKECKRTKAYASREGLVYHLINYHDQ